MEHVKAVLDDELSLRCRVVLVSFVRDGAENWQDAAEISPEKHALMLIDEQRDVYQRFGLARGSTFAIW
jgi:hypothetical protein